MLLAYLDEVGDVGPFISREHPKYKGSPAFGYAGFVIPENAARSFGSQFAFQKRTLFATEIASAPQPDQWEKKGSELFRPTTPKEFPQYIRVFGGLLKTLRSLGGAVFYYVDEKPLGTPKETKFNAEQRESDAMREVLNRIGRFADSQQENVMIILDQINEVQRAHRIPNMHGHIYSRSIAKPEMRRILEPPMHVDSALSSNIQFADWIAAAVSRAVDYQLIKDSKYDWVPSEFMKFLSGSFTSNSKLHLHEKIANDLNHVDLFKDSRQLF